MESGVAISAVGRQHVVSACSFERIACLPWDVNCDVQCCAVQIVLSHTDQAVSCSAIMYCALPYRAHWHVDVQQCDVRNCTHLTWCT